MLNGIKESETKILIQAIRSVLVLYWDIKFFPRNLVQFYITVSKGFYKRSNTL